MAVSSNKTRVSGSQAGLNIDLLKRHKSFWKKESTFGPLLGFAPNSRKFPLQNTNIEHEGDFLPEDITDELILSDARFNFPVISGDQLFSCKIPMEAVEWSQAYLGSRIFVSSKAKTVWAKPYKNIPESIDDLDKSLQPEWLRKLVECTKINVSNLPEGVFACESLLRGPADCLEAIIGASEMCMWILDQPEKMSVFLEWITERVIELHSAQLNVTPRFESGSFNRYRIWGPGKNIVTQADVSSLVSPGHFRKLMLPHYDRLSESFDTSTIHFHSCAYQHVDALMEIKSLDAIEWAMDPVGPSLEDMIPIFQKILKEKCLILMNITTEEEVDMLLNKLPHEGLCIIKRKEY